MVAGPRRRSHRFAARPFSAPRLKQIATAVVVAQDEPRARSRAARELNFLGYDPYEASRVRRVFLKTTPSSHVWATPQEVAGATRGSPPGCPAAPCAPYRNGNAAEVASAKEKEIRNGAGGSSAARQQQLLQQRRLRRRLHGAPVRRRAAEGGSMARPCVGGQRRAAAWHAAAPVRRRAVEGGCMARPCVSPQAPPGLGRAQLHFVLNVLIQTPSRLDRISAS